MNSNHSDIPITLCTEQALQLSMYGRILNLFHVFSSLFTACFNVEMKDGLAASKDAAAIIKSNVVLLKQLHSCLYHLFKVGPLVPFCMQDVNNTINKFSYADT